MNEQTVSLTDLKRSLSEIVNRAAYGDERIILLSRGKARAAIIGIKDLERLMALEREATTSQKLQEQLDLLAGLDALRAQMVEAGETSDSVASLHEVREERLDDLTDMS